MLDELKVSFFCGGPRLRRGSLSVFIWLLLLFSPPRAIAEERSIIIGEAVRGIMYAPVYIAEEKEAKAK